MNEGMDNQISAQTVYKGESTQEKPQPGPELRSEGSGQKRKIFVVFSVIATILLAVATGYFLFINNIRNNFVSQSRQEVADESWINYKNKNGFEVSYPKNMQFSETTEGASLADEGELSFIVGKLEEESLRAVINELAANFNIDTGDSPETFTVDSRTGYKLSHEGVTYYYFPLFNDFYLEIANKGEGKTEEIISRLKFVAPQSASIN